MQSKNSHSMSHLVRSIQNTFITGIIVDYKISLMYNS